ncbi:MAG: MFS transporter [Candidatus Bathyarchaeia archaeon]
MWWLSFAFHEMASGLLSVFIPLYIVSLGGFLSHIGLMSMAAILLSIPASLLWGYLCDKSRRYKPYISLSFLSLAIFLHIFSLTTDISLLIVLYAIMAFFHAAHEPPKNALIAESFMRRCWEEAYSVYGYITNIGWLIGTLIGFYLSIQGVSSSYVLIVCSILNLVAFILSIFLVKDPRLVFERSLVKIERSVQGAYKGLIVALRAMDNRGHVLEIMGVSTKGFCLGLIIFFMATRILFTPLPIFLSKDLALQESIVYALFCINSAGNVIGYLLAGKLGLNQETLYKISALRCILTLTLTAAVLMQDYGVMLTAVVLLFMGLTYAIFYILSLSLSMEILPEGMAGMFNVVAGLGEAFGSFVGPFIAEKLGFSHLFLSAGIIFFAACLILKKYRA